MKVCLHLINEDNNNKNQQQQIQPQKANYKTNHKNNIYI